METTPRVFTVCITGPESTGKSSLAHALARHYDTFVVEEFAREYTLGKVGMRGPWIDLEYVLIAEEQARRQLEVLRDAGDREVLICDTDPFTVWIWHRFYVEQEIPEIASIAEDFVCDLYILPSTTGTSFVPDGVRDPAMSPLESWDRFKELLEAADLPYVVVSGDLPARVSQACAAIDDARASAVERT